MSEQRTKRPLAAISRPPCRATRPPLRELRLPNLHSAFSQIEKASVTNDAQIPLVLGLTLAQWIQVASVFLSAFLAMVVGILLDVWKSHREELKGTREKQEKELRQINVVMAGIGFNVETLLHVVAQNIVPHYKASHAAYTAFLEAARASELGPFAAALSDYKCLIMTCPGLHFMECDFWRELPFIAEREPELLKQTGWLTAFARELENATSQRNRLIEAAMSLLQQQAGALNDPLLHNVLQQQASISNTECIAAYQLFDVLRKMARHLEKLSATYTVPGKKSKLIAPSALDDTINELAQIVSQIGRDMPAGDEDQLESAPSR